MTPRCGPPGRPVRQLPTAQTAAVRTRMHTVSDPHVCRGGRCQLAGGQVVLCERHAAVLVGPAAGGDLR